MYFIIIKKKSNMDNLIKILLKFLKLTIIPIIAIWRKKLTL